MSSHSCSSRSHRTRASGKAVHASAGMASMKARSSNGARVWRSGVLIGWFRPAGKAFESPDPAMLNYTFCRERPPSTSAHHAPLRENLSSREITADLPGRVRKSFTLERRKCTAQFHTLVLAANQESNNCDVDQAPTIVIKTPCRRFTLGWSATGRQRSDRKPRVGMLEVRF
jgi:hypothetical protein